MKEVFVFITLTFLLNISLRAEVNSLTVAISATPSSLSPFYATDANAQNINRLLHMSLVDANKEMKFICIACETFSVGMQNKREVIKFKLKKNLIFSDGTLVSSEDVKKSWEYFAQNSKINSTFMGSFEAIEKINILDKENLEIVFKDFSLDNLANLALLKIVKINNPYKDNLELNEIIGCGEYVLDRVEPLEIKIKPKDTKKPIIIFKVVKDETTLALKLIHHEVDLSVVTMSPRKTNWLKKQKSLISTWETPSANFIFIGLNHKHKIFKNKNIRRAISLLIPRKDLLKYKLLNSAQLSNGMFSSAFSEMYDNKPIDEYNPALAKKLLGGQKIEVDWKVSNNKATIEIAEVIQSYLEQAGIKVNITIQEWGTFMSSYKAGNFDLVLAQWVGFNGPQMLNFVYQSDNVPPKGGNRTNYKNAEVDQLLNEAITEIDNQKRITLYKKAQEVIRDDYASINLWHPNIVWIGTTCLKKVDIDPTGSFDSLPNIEKNCGTPKI